MKTHLQFALNILYIYPTIIGVLTKWFFWVNFVYFFICFKYIHLFLLPKRACTKLCFRAKNNLSCHVYIFVYKLSKLNIYKYDTSSNFLNKNREINKIPSPRGGDVYENKILVKHNKAYIDFIPFDYCNNRCFLIS